MAGISRFEKVVLALTAAFLLFTAGWFFSQRSAAQPYQVTTTKRLQEEMATSAASSVPDDYPDSLLEGEVIDVNRADIFDLQRLPGIGEGRAQDIIDYRQENGLFKSKEELMQVSGIGQGILDGVWDYITLG